MLMPKKNRVAIYEHLFKEGVMVAEKDFHAPKHPELETIPNLQVSLVGVVHVVLVMIPMELPFDFNETKPLLPSF